MRGTHPGQLLGRVEPVGHDHPAPLARGREVDEQRRALDARIRDALVGVGATEAVARGAADILRPGGALVLEVAEGSADRIATLWSVFSGPQTLSGNPHGLIAYQEYREIVRQSSSFDRVALWFSQSNLSPE